MQSFVTPYEQSIISGLAETSFNTFSRPIVIWKKPIEVALSAPNVTYQGTYGFNEGPVAQNLTYIPVSGIFSAIVRYRSYRHIGEAEVLQDTNAFNVVGEVLIKVKKDCHDYIESGKTDKFDFDGRSFFFAGVQEAHPYMSSLFYLYQLKPLQ
jgi:hypothetical protein